MAFLDIALALANRQVPVVPLRARSKIAFLENWQDLATCDQDQIAKWAEAYPDSNCAAVAKAELGGVWFWEVDGPDAVKRFENETGVKLPKTFRVRSRPGRGHYYFRQNASSISMGNIAQGFVKHSDFSVRVNAQYVVGPGSVHPISGEPYVIVSDVPIVEAPQQLIDWLISQKTSGSVKEVEENDHDSIPSGRRNSTLASRAGRLRQAGLDYEGILSHLRKLNETLCEPPLPDYEIETIARSISSYPTGEHEILLINGHKAGTAPTAPIPANLIKGPEDIEPPIIETIKYPEFPRWVMNETSIYEGLVKPWCDANSRYPEFMFMPAMAILLNYLATKVRIAFQPISLSWYMTIIGRRGQVIKSASVESAISYFQQVGILDHAGKSSNVNAGGKALVWTVGSPEGFGSDLQRTNCKNGILFYDELSLLSNKAGIDSSSMNSALLSMYESAKFQNTVKSRKDSFSLEPNTYCVSLIACDTDKNFRNNWSKLCGASTGLNDRFFFLLQPEVLIPITPLIEVNTKEGAVKTRNLIDQAIIKQVYEVEDMLLIQELIKYLGNRPGIRAIKLALGFAVDLGRDIVDGDCMERAVAIVKYESEVKKYLGVNSAEALTMEGRLQSEILFRLRQRKGMMLERDLCRELNAIRYGASVWNNAMKALINAEYVRLVGKGVKGDPQYVQLLRVPNEDD